MASNRVVINRVLIANRGEIAVRIIRTCRKLGVSCAVVYTEPDASSDAVKMADCAVSIGAPSNYLNMDLIIEAAKKTSSQAIHPGFGFLSENAEFAKRVEEAGLIWIGPSPYSITTMGSKIGAKNFLSQSNTGKVPLIPGYQGEAQDDDSLVKAAKSIGYPVLLKASAGGGGKGMRVVRSDSDLLQEIQSARREAKESFGDGKLLIEKYFDSVRHVEIQILADSYNNVMHLFERDCSVQRRHQKVIEETPSPVLDEDLRRRMGQVAVTIGKAINYRSAGTVEFILDDQLQFYFLEVNTRLQVEHPVTEAITGLDLVELQIKIAEGYSLIELGLISKTGDEYLVKKQGHAIQCRLYAEDPLNNFFPSPGKLKYFIPGTVEHVRYDSGVCSGSDISVYYDPMVAKVIAWGKTRAEALQRMRQALKQTVIIGNLTTNQYFLIQVLEHPSFLAGNYNTHFIENHLPPKVRSDYVSNFISNHTNTPSQKIEEEIAIISMIFSWSINVNTQQLQKHVSPNFRNLRYKPESKSFRINNNEYKVEYLVEKMRPKPGNLNTTYQFTLNIGDSKHTLILDDLPQVSITQFPHEKHYSGNVSCFLDGTRITWSIFLLGDENMFVHSTINGFVQPVKKLPRLSLKFKDEALKFDYVCRAHMTGKVVDIPAKTGGQYKKGDVLVIMESMKMESKITAQKDVTVEKILVKPGQVVDDGQPLLSFVQQSDEQ